MKKFLDIEGVKYIISKVIGKTDISGIGDGTLKGAISSIKSLVGEKSSELSQEIDVERKRINNFTKLGEGSTTGDAELADMRVGADGKEYDTAGEAVRGQVGELNQTIDNQDKIIKKLWDNIIFESESIGYKFFKFNIRAGDEYEFTNNTNASCIIQTYDGKDGIKVETVSSALYPKNTVNFKAVQNAAWLQILFQASGNISAFKINSIVNKNTDKISKVEKDTALCNGTISSLKKDIENNLLRKVASANLIPSNTFTAEGILDTDGSIVASETTVLTCEMEVEAGRTISLTRIVSGSYGAYVRGKENMSGVVFYGEGKEIVSFIKNGTYKLETEDIVVPPMAKTCRVEFDNAYAVTYQPMVEYTDNRNISTDYAIYFAPYFKYNRNIDNSKNSYTVPYPLRPSFVKKSGQYNGCLSDVKTVDGKDILYGFSGSGIVRSLNGNDKGSPNINIVSPTSEIGTVNFIKKLDDGTLLVGYENVNGYCRVYKGTAESWDVSNSRFNSTWEEVLVAETANQRWSMWFGLSIHKNVVFISEYGDNNKARNAYISSDYGSTWKKVFTAGLDEMGAGVHIHDVCYDPYSEMLWVVTGDGYWAQNVYFSYDMGTTWNKNYADHESPSQFTNIIPLPGCILFTSDNTKHMAVYRCNRFTLTSKPTHIELEEAYVFFDNYDAESPIGTNACVVYGTHACAYFGWTERADAAKTKSPVIGTRDGYNFYVVWENDEAFTHIDGATTYVGIYGVYGVTENGNIGISFAKSESGTTGMHSIIMEAPEWCS